MPVIILSKEYEYTKGKIWTKIIMDKRGAGLNWNSFQFFQFIFAWGQRGLFFFYTAFLAKIRMNEWMNDFIFCSL